MTDYVIFHHPNCSKSRETLKILEEKGIDFSIRLYLEDPLTAKEALELFHKIEGVRPYEVIRIKDEAFKKEEIGKFELTFEKAAELVEKNPKLLERPVVLKDDKVAKICRPPENVFSLF